MGRELVGGQALVDGVMMRRGATWAAATRCADGSIATCRHEHRAALAGLRSIPVLRGVGALVDSLSIGLTAMRWSRDASSGAPPGDTVTTRRERVTVVAVVAGVVAVFLFVPLGAAALAGRLVGHGWAAALVEGVARLALFVAYLAAISQLEGVRRTLEYHGAEHMVIAAFEHVTDGDDGGVTVESARRHGVRHPRCGTDFLLLIVVISIVAFALLGRLPALWLVASRIVLAPVVVGVAYEVLRAGGAHHSRLGHALAAPGLWLQRFTTAEPSDDQIEVALAALDELVADAAPVGAAPAGSASVDEGRQLLAGGHGREGS